MNAARVLAALSVLAALIAAAYLIFADTYHGQGCSYGEDGVYRCEELSATLIEENGSWVLLLLALPVAA
jgi:hypothetical protein